MNTLPLISVLLPTYNRAHVLKRAINSVLNQTVQDFELIIIDDGSKDSTSEIVNEFGDRRILCVKHDINKGQNAALNTGLKITTGEYVAFIDSDDEWLPTMLEKQVDRFKSDVTISCSYTWACYYDAENIKICKEFTLEGNIYKEALAQGFVSHMITLMVRRDCFNKCGNFDIAFTVCQDDDICLRLAKYFKFSLVKEPLAVVHSDAGNQTIRNRMNYAQGWEKLFKKYKGEVINMCGRRTMASHYIKCARLYKDVKCYSRATLNYMLSFLMFPSFGIIKEYLHLLRLFFRLG